MPDDSIVYLHTEIMSLLDGKVDELPNLERKRGRLEWIVQHSVVRSDRLKAKVQLDDIVDEIERIRLESEKSEYLRMATPLLTQYTRLLNTPLHLDFMEGNVNIRSREYSLVQEFLEVASRYLESIDFSRYIPENIHLSQRGCPMCQTDRHCVETNTSVVCKRCGLERLRHNMQSTFSDAQRMNMSGRYKYTKKTHFKDAIYKYQGKDNKRIPDTIIERIKHEAYNHNLVREKAKTEHGKYRGLKKEHILTFLKQHKLNGYYDDVNKIHHTITGKPLPDLTHLEHDLFRLHAQVEEAFESTKVGRKSFLHIQYVLMQLLRHLKYPCNEREFALPRTETKLIEHDRDWKRICDVLGWKFHSTI